MEEYFDSAPNDPRASVSKIRINPKFLKRARAAKRKGGKHFKDHKRSDKPLRLSIGGNLPATYFAGVRGSILTRAAVGNEASSSA